MMKLVSFPIIGFIVYPFLVDGSIPAESKLGQNLLEKSRHLENNNYNNNYYSWIGNAALKFDGCASIPMYERDEGLRSSLLAKFKLCPTGKCGTCHNAGEYVVEMKEFVETYQEALKEANEYECENANYLCENSCQNGGGYYYDNGNDNGNDGQNYNYNNGNNGNNYNNDENNDEYCLYNCLMEQGLDYCIEGEDEMDINEFAECRPMNEENGNNNNYNYNDNNNYQMYYVGAYCTSSGVYAGVFSDSTCTKHAPSGTYEKYNYGYSLPTQPLVASTCMSCNANANNYNNNNNNNNNNGGISEVCDKLYEEALKCESNVAVANYKDTSGCEMIHNILPQLNSAMKNIRSPNVTKAAAWTFGIGFFALAGYLLLLHKKAAKQKMELEKSGYCNGIPA